MQERVKDLRARLKEQTDQLNMMNKQRELKHTLVQKQQEQVQVLALLSIVLKLHVAAFIVAFFLFLYRF